MSFTRKRRRRVRRGGLARVASAPVRAGAGLAHWALRVALALAVIVTVLLLSLWMRLGEGPVEMPWLAGLVAEQFNRGSSNLNVRVANMTFSLGDERRPAGLEFTGLDVQDAEGTPLLSIPRLAAKFDPADLVLGRLQPTEITLTGAATRVIRTEEGRIRFALRDAGGVEVEGAPAPRGVGRSMDAITRIVDGFVGDREPVPELAKLSRVAILDADLTYVNARLGRVWRSDRADLELRQTDDGAVLELDLQVIGDQEGKHAPGASIDIVAERRRGEADTSVRAGFESIRPKHLADELPELGWLALVEAPLSGRLSGSLGDDGSVGALLGEFRASDGRVLALEEEGVPFDRFALDFAYEPSTRRMSVGRLEIAAPDADLDLSGFADLSMDVEGALEGLAAQLDISALRFSLPEVFEGEQEFDDGQIVARIDLETSVVEVAEARLRRGPLAVSVSGRAMPGDKGWTTDLRATGEGIEVDRLIALWPLRAATGARRWLAKHLKSGTVDELVAQLRLGPGEPVLNLDFLFSGLSTTYVDQMSPVRGASGHGHLTWDRFDLTVEEGHVEPVSGQRIDLAGSTVRIDDIWAKPSPAEIVLRGRGASASVLALIDQEPLNLIEKLNLDPRSVGGTADVVAVLNMPLKKGLDMSDVEVDATADLASVRMPFSLDLTGPLSIAANRIEVAANTTGMTVSGSITADGTPLNLEWEERYGRGGKSRDIRLRGTVTPAELQAVNINIPGFDGGRAQADLRIAQTKGTPTRLDVEADLSKALVNVEPVLWSKPPGLSASVEASGSFDQRLVLDSFALSGPGLETEGSLRLFPAGGIERARVTRLDMGDLADLTVTVAARGTAGEGGFDLDVGGRWFDLAFFDRSYGRATTPVLPLTGRYAVDQVKVSEQITLGLVEGQFSRRSDGRLEAALNGRVSGVAPVDITYTRDAGRPGEARVTASDAGQVLKAAGLFAGAKGGRLVLDAVIAPNPATSFRGTALMKDIAVEQEARTFRRVLERGELGEVIEETRTQGITFNRVEVPFAFRGERIELGTALASSPALAVKVTGGINEATRRLDLRGVISPAYALTGALNNIPLLGTLLGGEGEGILAMTFSVSGSVDDPSITVNPLSLLAPGFLRNVFEGGAFTDISPPPPAPASPVARAAETTPPPRPRTPEEEAAADADQASRLRDLLDSDF